NSIFNGPLNVVLLRCGLGYLVAVVTGLVVDVQFKKHGVALLHRSVVKGLKDADAAAEEGGDGPRTWWQQLNNITQTALHDFVDIMAFLVLGAALAAGGRAIVEGNKDDEIERCPKCAAEVPIKRGALKSDQVVCPQCGTRFSVQQSPFTAIPLMMGIAI